MGLFIENLYLKICEAAKKFTDDRVDVYAAQASFFVIISAIPFIMLLITLLRFILPVRYDYIIEIIGDYAPEFILSYAEPIIYEILEADNIPIISVSAITLLWSASHGVKSIGKGIRNIYGTREKVGFIHGAFLSVGVTLILMLCIVSLAAFIMLERYLKFSIKGIFMLCAMTVVFMISYNSLSSSDMSFFSHFAGAVTSAAGWIVYSYGYAIYIENFTNYSYVYGSLAAVVLLMLWLYMCMTILLVGAEINVFLYKRNAQKQN